MPRIFGLTVSFPRTTIEFSDEVREHSFVLRCQPRRDEGIVVVKSELEIEPEVLDLIVDTSLERKLGARGLRSICEELMNDAMFEAPSSRKKTFKLTLEYAKERLAD